VPALVPVAGHGREAAPTGTTAAATATPRLTPKAIVRHLDLEVIGQDEAKKTLAVAI
jgi:ATP-dependent protease Clp ATPase subunit